MVITILDTRRALHLAAFATSCLLAPHVRAGDEDMLNERISAAACQPRNNADRSRITWTGTDWQFATGQTGTVVLECPIFTPFEDETTGTRTLSELRMWYSDSDGMSTNAHVSVDLRFVSGTSGSLGSVPEGSLNSNTSAITAVTTLTTLLGGAAMDDGQYFAVVTLFRNPGNFAVRFRGVSFFTKP